MPRRRAGPVPQGGKLGRISLKVTRADKREWEIAAAHSGESLSGYVVSRCRQVDLAERIAQRVLQQLRDPNSLLDTPHPHRPFYWEISTGLAGDRARVSGEFFGNGEMGKKGEGGGGGASEEGEVGVGTKTAENFGKAGTGVSGGEGGMGAVDMGTGELRGADMGRSRPRAVGVPGQGSEWPGEMPGLTVYPGRDYRAELLRDLEGLIAGAELSVEVGEELIGSIRARVRTPPIADNPGVVANGSLEIQPAPIGPTMGDVLDRLILRCGRAEAFELVNRIAEAGQVENDLDPEWLQRLISGDQDLAHAARSVNATVKPNPPVQESKGADEVQRVESGGGAVDGSEPGDAPGVLAGWRALRGRALPGRSANGAARVGSGGSGTADAKPDERSARSVGGSDARVLGVSGEAQRTDNPGDGNKTRGISGAATAALPDPGSLELDDEDGDRDDEVEEEEPEDEEVPHCQKCDALLPPDLVCRSVTCQSSAIAEQLAHREVLSKVKPRKAPPRPNQGLTTSPVAMAQEPDRKHKTAAQKFRDRYTKPKIGTGA